MGIAASRYSQMPNNGERLKAIVAGTDGMALVTGLPFEQNSAAIQLTPVTDKNSGLTVLLRQYTQPDSGTAFYTVCLGFASAIGQANAIQRLTTPASSDESESSGA
jgi:hypothetical protein